MRRDYKAAIKIAVNAIYSNDEDEMKEGLFEILTILDPNMAENMREDEDSVMSRVNLDEDESDEDDEDDGSIDPSSYID